MNADIKHIQRRPYLQPVAVLCILLILLVSDRNVCAAMMNAEIGLTKSETQPAPAGKEIRLLSLESLNTGSNMPTFDISKTNALGFISGVSLYGDRTIAFKIHDKTRLAEIELAIKSVDPTVAVQVTDEEVILVFSEAIAPSVKNALEGDTLNLSMIGGSGGGQNLLGPCLVIIGLGVVTYYAFKWL
ncbi:MAG: hypothetical protein RLY66_354, partial [Candidatus Parcubacteria bacterium]